MILGIDFNMDFVGFWVPKWSQVGTTWDQKSVKKAFGASPLVPNWVQEVQVGSKNRSKIDPKMESTMECILASIFDTFQWILGGKLGSKMDQKSIQKGIGKRMQKRNDFVRFGWGGRGPRVDGRWLGGPSQTP